MMHHTVLTIRAASLSIITVLSGGERFLAMTGWHADSLSFLSLSATAAATARWQPANTGSSPFVGAEEEEKKAQEKVKSH